MTEEIKQKRDEIAKNYGLDLFPIQNIETRKDFTQDINFARRMTHTKAYQHGFDAGFAIGLEQAEVNSIHTCHDQCQRLACVQRREIEKLKSDLKDYYLTQEKYKESYEYGLKLKDENEELKRFSDRQSDQYHVTRLKLEELKADTKMLIEALEEIKFYEDDFVKSSKETGTYYLRVVNEALTEWNKKRGGV